MDAGVLQSLKKIIHIVGTRPNYVKAAPVIEEMRLRKYNQLCVNTGQHPDSVMSSDIISSLGMSPPDRSFSLKESDPFSRFGEIISNVAETIKTEEPGLVMVYGDVDSTLAAAWVAVRLGVPVAHVESGLRSFDRTMPEENNRIMVDQLASIHFVTEPAGSLNLLKEGYKESIHVVGNTMIDSLKRLQDSMGLRKAVTNRILLTCHRPSNVDDISFFNELYVACQGISLPILWPIHPRTKKSLLMFNLYESFASIKHLSIVDPMDYATFLKEMSESAAVITDSGGIQEETTYLNIPCLTIRKNTERPITIKEGSNTLVSVQSLPSHIKSVEAGTYKSAKKIINWDGEASHRICDTLEGLL